MQDPQGQTDHLEILAAGGGGDVARLGADIVDDGALQPGNQEVGALIDDVLAHSGQPVEDDSAGATLHIIHSSLGDGCADGEWHGPLVDGLESVGHGEDGGTGLREEAIEECGAAARSGGAADGDGGGQTELAPGSRSFDGGVVDSTFRASGGRT